MQKIKEKKWVLGGLIIAAVVFLIVAVLTEIPAGGADNYAHFNISRWAFRYPHLFLDHWGKPIFTLLTAPFAQFGVIGLRFFNILCGLLTAWFSYKLARHFQLEFAWFTVFAVIFIPIYFVILFTGMTEVLFGLFLVVSVFWFFKEKYILSALLISFVFLVRTEGLIFIPLFLIAFLFKKQYKAIPFLFAGFLLFSFIGWIYYYHDFWWLINKRPYATGEPTIYGSGDWFHFFAKMPTYFGVVISVLLVTGTIFLVVKWIRGKFKFSSEAFYQILIILGCFWGYFFAHTYLWWKTENSAGLVRVMAGVAPLAAIIGVFSFSAFTLNSTRKKITSAALIILALVLVLGGGKFYKRSVKSDLSAEVLKRTTKWLKESGSLNHKLVMHNPYFAFSTEIDAWDSEVVQYGFSNSDYPENGLADSTLFIWDGHFSANEGRLPLNKVVDNPRFEPVKYFEPQIPFKMGSEDYKIVVFRKISNSTKNNRQILETLKKEEFSEDVVFSQIYRFENSFEDVNLEKRRLNLENDNLNFIFNMNGLEFSPAFEVGKKEIPKLERAKFKLSADFNCNENSEPNRLLMVFSAEIKNKSYHYVVRDIYAQVNKINVWTNCEFVFNGPLEIKKGTVFKAYIWSIDKDNVLIDNLKFEITKQVSKINE